MQTDKSCRTILFEFFSYLKLLHLAQVSQDCPGISLVGSSGHQVTPIFRDIPGLSWNIPCGILWTPSHTNLQGHPRTDLGCPLWDPPDTKSHESSGTSQDCPGMSLVGSSGHQVTPIFKDVPGLSWDVPCRTLRTKSHTNLQGRPRTVLGLGCPLRDLLDTKSHQSSGMSLMGSSGHQVTPIYRDIPGQSWDV